MWLSRKNFEKLEKLRRSTSDLTGVVAANMVELQMLKAQVNSMEQARLSQPPLHSVQLQLVEALKAKGSEFEVVLEPEKMSVHNVGSFQVLTVPPVTIKASEAIKQIIDHLGLELEVTPATGEQRKLVKKKKETEK